MSSTSQPKQHFLNISPRAWEHPSAQAAQAALQRIPGIDMLLQRLLGATSESALRLISLSSAVRVSPRQFSHLHELLQEACRILDAPSVPELYVAQQPFFQAGPIGVERPFIVLHASALANLTEEETLCVISQELAHCLSGHALYKTLLQILLKLSSAAFQLPLGGIALLPMMMALMEWNRKSALSADRAGLLVTQDPVVSYGLLMKMAGGPQATQMDVNEFFAQADEYDRANDILTSTHKWLSLILASHPFPVIRLTELQAWVNSGQYARILSQHYTTRSDDAEQGQVQDTVERVTERYKEQLDTSKDAMAGVVSELITNVDTFAHQARQGLESWLDLTGLGLWKGAGPKRPEASQTDTHTAAGQTDAESDIFAMLVKLHELQNQGVITAEEFEAQKAKLLSRI